MCWELDGGGEGMVEEVVHVSLGTTTMLQLLLASDASHVICHFRVLYISVLVRLSFVFVPGYLFQRSNAKFAR